MAEMGPSDRKSPFSLQTTYVIVVVVVVVVVVVIRRLYLGTNFAIKFLPKNPNTIYAWSAIAFFLTSWFSGKTNSFVALIFLERSEDGMEPG